MNVSAPIRRQVPRCLYNNQPLRLHTSQRRNASTNDPPSDDPNNLVLAAYRRQGQTGSPTQQQQAQASARTAGDIASSSIFEDDRRAQVQANQSIDPTGSSDAKRPRDPEHMQRALDPDPNARERWERKKVIQMIRKGGRLTKEQYIKRTEREHLLKSENMKTSIKKLGKLANQIQGKSVEEAIVQMRFSKKKVAAAVLAHLEAARDEAVVMRGMGLDNTSSTEPATTTTTGQLTALQPSQKSPLDIQLKDGSRHSVTQASKIYIDQAWVGRGPYGQLPEYRARGKVNILKTPWTSMSVVLKEEATRVREWREREEKRRKARVGKVWVPLPDRPVQGARGQWYAW